MRPDPDKDTTANTILADLENRRAMLRDETHFVRVPEVPQPEEIDYTYDPLKSLLIAIKGLLITKKPACEYGKFFSGDIKIGGSCPDALDLNNGTESPTPGK